MKSFVRTIVSVAYVLLFVLALVPVISTAGGSYSLFDFFMGTPLHDTMSSMGMVVTYVNIVSLQAIAIFSLILILAVLGLTLQPRYDGVSIFIKIIVAVSLFFYSAWLGITKFALTGCSFTVFALIAILLYIVATFAVVFSGPEAEDNTFK